jgi:GNAT superfamily N-acetyltransferase
MVSMAERRHFEAVVREPVHSPSGAFEVHLYDGDERIGHVIAEHEADGQMVLRTIHVFERYREQGFGTALLDHFEDAALQLGYSLIRGLVTWPGPDVLDEETACRRAGWFLRRGYRVRRRVHGDWEVERWLL